MRSAITTDSGRVRAISASDRSRRQRLACARAPRRARATTACSISAPEKPVGCARERRRGRTSPGPGRACAGGCGRSPRATSAIGQVDEEDLVEAPLAHQLRRQRLDVVRVATRNTRLLRSAIQVSSVPSTRRDSPPSAVVPSGDALLDLVDPQHARRHRVGGLQRLAQVALGLAEELVVQRAEVEPHQRHAPRARDRLGGEALAAALHAEQHDALGHVEPWRRRPRRGTRARRRSSQRLQRREPGDVGEARGFDLERQHAVAARGSRASA